MQETINKLGKHIESEVEDLCIQTHNIQKLTRYPTRLTYEESTQSFTLIANWSDQVTHYQLSKRLDNSQIDGNYKFEMGDNENVYTLKFNKGLTDEQKLACLNKIDSIIKQIYKDNRLSPQKPSTNSWNLFSNEGSQSKESQSLEETSKPQQVKKTKQVNSAGKKLAEKLHSASDQSDNNLQFSLADSKLSIQFPNEKALRKFIQDVKNEMEKKNNDNNSLIGGDVNYKQGIFSIPVKIETIYSIQGGDEQDYYKIVAQLKKEDPDRAKELRQQQPIIRFNSEIASKCFVEVLNRHAKNALQTFIGDKCIINENMIPSVSANTHAETITQTAEQDSKQLGDNNKKEERATTPEELATEFLELPDSKEETPEVKPDKIILYGTREDEVAIKFENKTALEKAVKVLGGQSAIKEQGIKVFYNSPKGNLLYVKLDNVNGNYQLPLNTVVAQRLNALCNFVREDEKEKEKFAEVKEDGKILKIDSTYFPEKPYLFIASKDKTKFAAIVFNTSQELKDVRRNFKDDEFQQKGFQGYSNKPNILYVPLEDKTLRIQNEDVAKFGKVIAQLEEKKYVGRTADGKIEVVDLSKRMENKNVTRELNWDACAAVKAPEKSDNNSTRNVSSVFSGVVNWFKPKPDVSTEDGKEIAEKTLHNDLDAHKPAEHSTP